MPLFRASYRTCLFTALAGAALLAPCDARAQVLVPQYTISTFAGSGSSTFGGDGGSATGAGVSVNSFSFDSSGNMYIADAYNNRVRKVTAGGAISTIAGNGTKGYHGDGGNPVNAELNEPAGVAVDSTGIVYIADTGNQVIRKIGADGKIITFSGNFTTGAGFSGDGAGAFEALLNTPTCVVTDPSGNLYICDSGNNRIRKVVKGVISTIAGNGIPGFSDGVLGSGAELDTPEGVALDSAGNLFIADSQNFAIRRVDAVTGIISTVAGTPYYNGFSGDGGPALSALLNHPKGIAVDASGDIFIADSYNSRIRMVTPYGNIVTVAGNGTNGFSGDGGPALNASLGFPSGVAVGSNGIYIDDDQNNRVRLLTAVPEPPAISSGGVISASGFGAFTTVAQGSYIEIYGANLAADTRSWQSSDFTNNIAPTSLDGTSVTVGGQPAYVYAISPTQVNVLVPSTAPPGAQSVVLKTVMGSTNTVTVNVAATEPGLLAPASFRVNGSQYVVATTTDGSTYIAPTGAIPGVTSRPAQPGETIVIYGIGFGATTPAVPVGQIDAGLSPLTVSPQFIFGSTPTTVSYAGLAPGFVDLYQFNVVVPAVSPSDTTPLSFTLGAVSGAQNLVISVGP